MSSNNAEAALARATPAASGAWSITARLSLLYALATCILLAVAASLLYWALESTLNVDDQQLLRAKVYSLRAILREHLADPVLRRALLVHEVEEEGGVHEPFHQQILYVRVIDVSGRVLIETPGMSSAVPVAQFAAADGLRDGSEEPHAWISPHGREYWLLSAGAGDRAPSAELIQVALDDTAEDALLRGFRHYTLAILVAGALGSVVAGFVITRRGMEPLRTIARTAEGITASRLHDRIDPMQWPQEVAALAHAFNRMLASLEESFQRLSQSSAELAHELRTPIHDLAGEAEIALSRDRDANEYRRVLESNLEECAHLTRMIDGMLFLAHADNPRTEIRRECLDGRRELHAVCEFHEALAEELGVVLICEGEAEIQADPLLLRRALTNVLSNALRHTPRGGSVRLSAAQPQAHQAVITVADTGCGIADAHLARVFDRFYRAPGALERSPGGAGLGLAIVESIMSLHEGSVKIRSSPGCGTSVELNFPGATDVCRYA